MSRSSMHLTWQNIYFLIWPVFTDISCESDQKFIRKCCINVSFKKIIIYHYKTIMMMKALEILNTHQENQWFTIFSTEIYYHWAKIFKYHNFMYSTILSFGFPTATRTDCANALFLHNSSTLVFQKSHLSTMSIFSSLSAKSVTYTTREVTIRVALAKNIVRSEKG